MENPSNIKAEVASAHDGYAEYIFTSLTLPVKAKLFAFAVEHGINEHEATAVILARYFRMVEDDRWASWLVRQDPEPPEEGR